MPFHLFGILFLPDCFSATLCVYSSACGNVSSSGQRQPSAPYWVCQRTEEADQSSGSTHSILSCQVALWWKRSLQQTCHTCIPSLCQLTPYGSYELLKETCVCEIGSCNRLFACIWVLYLQHAGLYINLLSVTSCLVITNLHAVLCLFNRNITSHRVELEQRPKTTFSSGFG